MFPDLIVAFLLNLLFFKPVIGQLLQIQHSDWSIFILTFTSFLAFTPRSISVPAKPASKLEPMKFVKAKEQTNGTNGASSSSNGDSSSGKSNEDFRKLLNK